MGRAVSGVARGRRRRRTAGGARPWPRVALEATALLATALIVIVAVLGRLAATIAGAGFWWSLFAVAGTVLVLGVATSVVLRGWMGARRRLAVRAVWMPAAGACAIALVAAAIARRPGFHDDLASLRTLIGGPAETHRQTIAHQVYAAYRRTDLAAMTRMLERARVYEPTVLEAAAAFDVDPEVLMGVGSAESSFYPRDSPDGGRGLFQITAPPTAATTEVRRRLGGVTLDPLNQRHNAFLAAATLRLYLDQMAGDPFLGLLAYNIGPHNGGLRAIMQQYGARDFVTIQPYLQLLPRDYPIRVLSAALAYRLWRTEGRLPRYEEGDNARRIQRVGVPGLTAAEPPRITAQRAGDDAAR